jgi:hypothetical protein
MSAADDIIGFASDVPTSSTRARAGGIRERDADEEAEVTIIPTRPSWLTRLVRLFTGMRRRRWMRRFHDSIDIGPFN